jgi:hypothetical protein
MKYVILFSIFLMCIPAKAKESENRAFNNYVGLNAGYTSGLGFTFGYWPNKIGAQISILPISTEQEKFFSLAITTFYTLKKGNHIKSYFFLGNHLVSNEIDTEYNIGFGPGFEVGSRVVYSLRGGFGFYDITDTFSMLPTIDMGVYFKF